MSLLIAFAGQGSPHGKMFAQLNADSFGKIWLKEASELLHLDLLDESVVDRACADVVLVQCLIVVLSVGTFYALQKQINLNSAFLCGYSLGEVSAFCASANLRLVDICDLVRNRASLMQQAVTQASGMVALKGNITFTQVMQLTQTHTCYLAIIIAEDHYVVGGLLTDLDALLDKAKNSGVKRAEKLAVKLPSHTPLLAQATVNFASYLQQFAAVSLELPILNALTQELIFNSQEMVPILANELSQTLHWNQVMSIAKEYGCSLLLEIGSGTALKNMASFQQLKAYSVEEFRSVQGVATFLKANA